MKKTTVSTLLAAAGLLTAGTAAAGPIGTYYVTDTGDINSGVPSWVWGIRDSGFVKNPMVHPGQEGALAIVQPGVGPEVRTTGYFPGAAGSGYVSTPDQALTPTGIDYPSTTQDYLVDGTSDQQYNYSVSYLVGTNAGKVLRFDHDWTNPLPLFNTGNSMSFGITYDAANNSLWVTSAVDNSLGGYNNIFSDFDLTGDLLSSFTVVGLNDIWLTALAMDLDHTLWTVGNSAPGTAGNGLLYHYATDGTFLGSESVGEEIIEGFGGEIAVPEPATLALFGLGVAGLTARRRSGRNPVAR